MLTIFYILLLIKTGRCSDHQIFDTKNVAVEENVTLNCIRDRLWHSTNLFWIRLVSQSFPEIVGSTMSYDSPIIENIHHITTKQEPGTFVLHINGAQLSDTAVYYCIKVRQPKLFTVFMCLFATCTEDHSVYWYRAKPEESHPSLIYSHGNNGNYCERSPEAASQQKCVYSFSRNVSSSDTGTYYCAVATCGEILFGNGTKLDIEVVQHWDLQKTNTIVFLLCVALSISLIVIAFLIYTIKEKNKTSGKKSYFYIDFLNSIWLGHTHLQLICKVKYSETFASDHFFTLF
uniref:Ig-like domain-containing protein n=1 Tax=Pundamilia nyererei TaxID=303518 RepID=A0A3B4GVT6_9CICH